MPGTTDVPPSAARPAEPKAPRVLLVRLSALGDVVQCLEALAALRAALPAAEIGWLIEDRNAALLEGHPHLDRVFVYRRRAARGLGALGVALGLRRELRSFAPDVAVDLQGNLKGAVLAWLSGARRRIGLPRGETREGAHLFATERPAAGPPGEHRADRALRLVAALGAPPGPAAMLAPSSPEQRAAMEAALPAGDAPFAVFVPGTSAFGAFKRWPPAEFGELARALTARRGLRVLVSAGPGEDDLADAVVTAARGAAERAPRTRSLGELLALLERAALVVGADSGPVVLAATLGVPTVALLGPKDPEIYAPRGEHVAVVWKGVYCSPCSLRRCRDPICMTTLSPEAAHEAVERVLSSREVERAPSPSASAPVRRSTTP